MAKENPYDWEKRYVDLLNWIEDECWDLLADTPIPDELYHVSPRCGFCNMRHYGGCY